MRVLMRAAFLVMCSAALLRAQGASGPPRGDVRGDVRGDAEEVITTLNAMWSAIEAGDVERYAAFVHPDFAQFGESDPYLFEGKAREVRAMGEYLMRAKGMHTEMHNPKVTVRGGVAWITYYWTDEGAVNGVRTTSAGKSTRIFVKENGRWLCIHGHYTLR